jgi:hypothetical protein
MSSPAKSIADEEAFIPASDYCGLDGNTDTTMTRITPGLLKGYGQDCMYQIE